MSRFPVAIQQARLPMVVLTGFVTALAVAFVFFIEARGGPSAPVKAIGAMATFGLACAAIARPRLALLVVLVASTFRYTTSIGGSVRQTSELATLAMIPGLIVGVRAQRIPWVLKLGSGMLTTGAAIACLRATDDSAAIWGAVDYGSALLVMWSTCSLCARDANAKIQLARWLTALGAISGILAFGQRAGYYFLTGPPYTPNRINATFGYYTVYASFAAMTVIVGLGLSMHLWRRDIAGAVVTLGLATLSLGGLLLSDSRGGVLSVVVGAATLVALRLRSPLRAVLLAAALGFGGVIVALLFPGPVGALVQRLTNPQGGDVVRARLHQTGLLLLRHNPLGIGTGNFGAVVAATSVGSVREIIFHSHELFYQVGLDAGWLGLMGLILLIVGAFTSGVKRASTNPGALEGVFVAAACGFLAQGLNDYVLYEFGALAVFAVVLTCAFASSTEGAPLSSRKVSRPEPVPGRN